MLKLLAILSLMILAANAAPHKTYYKPISNSGYQGNNNNLNSQIAVCLAIGCPTIRPPISPIR